MALHLTLKPHEHVIVGGAAIRNGDSRAELLIENEVPVLRESDILSPGAVRSPCERVYLALQLVYVDGERGSQHLASLEQLAAEVRIAAPSLAPDLQAMDELVKKGKIYQAIKRAQVLLQRERRLVSDVH